MRVVLAHAFSAATSFAEPNRRFTPGCARRCSAPLSLLIRGLPPFPPQPPWARPTYSWDAASATFATLQGWQMPSSSVARLGVGGGRVGVLADGLGEAIEGGRVSASARDA
jgi:hypothetical protein